MLTLYHYDRSTAAQRVRLALEEKGIPWQSVIVDTARGDVENLPEDYHRLNPKGLVPVIIHDGAAIPESLVILEYLDDAFGAAPLRPDSAAERARMRLWMRRIDESVHVASRVVGVCIVNRHIYREKGEAKIQKYYGQMRDGVRKRNDLVNIEEGLDSPLLPDAVRTFRSLFEEMDGRIIHDGAAVGASRSPRGMVPADRGSSGLSQGGSRLGGRHRGSAPQTRHRGVRTDEGTLAGGRLAGLCRSTVNIQPSPRYR
jgi:glutathione S-transferase